MRTLEDPEVAALRPAEMVARAVSQLRGRDTDPMLIGRIGGAYDALRSCPSTIVEAMNSIQGDGRK